jgi:hypothetical protein
VEVQAEAETKAAAKAAKQAERNVHIRSIAEFEREAMGREDVTDATPRPNFGSTKRSSCNYDESDLVGNTDDKPDLDWDSPDGPADEGLESEDLAKMVNATPVPARRRKSQPVATKKTKLNPPGKSKSKASKQLDDIEEDPESEEELLVSKKGPGSVNKGRLIVEDSETSDRDSPVTKKSRVSNNLKTRSKVHAVVGLRALLVDPTVQTVSLSICLLTCDHDRYLP